MAQNQMKLLSPKTWLTQVFLRLGFFLLGAYIPGVLVWFIIVSPQVNQKQAPSTQVLAGLAFLQALIVGLSGIVGMVLLAWLQRTDIAFRYPVGVVILAAIGYLLAVSVVP